MDTRDGDLWRRSRRWAAILGLWMVVALVTTAGAASPAGRPDDEWPSAVPETAGLDPGKLAEVLTTVETQSVPLHSLLLLREGTMVLDAYHYPYDGSIYHDVASVT